MFTPYIKRATELALSYTMLNNQLTSKILFGSGNSKATIRSTESAKLIYKEHRDVSSARNEEKIIRALDRSVPKSLEKNGVFLPLHYGKSAEDYRKIYFDIEAVRETSALTHLQILLSTAHKLAYIHSQKILHRDLKLKNIIVCPRRHAQNISQWHAQIIDYESSSFIDTLKDKAVVTDLGYVAPEVLKKDGVDFSSDIYSFGICFLRLFYQGLFSNKKIHQGDFSQVKLNFNDYGFSLSEQKQLKNLLYGMLANDPKSRPSLIEVIDSLSDIYRQHSEVPYQKSAPISIRDEAQLLAVKEEELLGMEQSKRYFADHEYFTDNFALLQKECQEHIPYQLLSYR